jgi:DNA polymerase-3 subunit delta'
MFPHLKDDLIKSAIQENENNYIDTCNQLSNNTDKLEQENSFISWARLCFKIVHKQEVATLVQWCNTTASLEIDKQRSFLTLAMSIFRKSFLKKYILKQHIYPDIQNISFIDKFSKHIDEDNIYDIYSLLDKANYYINRNVNSKLIFLDLSFSIGRLLQNKQNNSS